MKILIKYVLKNMKEKKFRLFLILISITLSSGLFFATTSISNNVVEIYAKQMRAYSGDSDITIYPANNARTYYFTLKDLENLEEYSDYMIGTIGGSGVYKGSDEQEQKLSIFGTTVEDMEIYNPIQLIHTLSGQEFTGKSVIMNSTFAKKNQFEVGDRIEIQMNNGVRYKFTVWGIADSEGIFKENGFQSTFLMPRDTLSGFFEVKGKITQAYISVKPELLKEVGLDSIIEQFKQEIEGFDIVESLSEDELRQAVAQIATIFQIMLVLVIFISVYIIYSSFKVMMTERLPVVGTFRSIGATKRSTNFIMIAESLMYGLLGGTIGSGLGVFILKLMMDQMAYDPYSGIKSNVELHFSPVNIFATILLAVLLAVVSSVIPIVQASKLPVKDIVLDKISKTVPNNHKRTIIGFVMMALAILLPVTKVFAKDILMNLLCMIISIVGMVMILPFITEIFVWLFEKIFSIFGNNGTLAIKNLKGNKSVQGNIILLTIGIASLMMINIISYSVSVEVVNVYNEGDFEVWAWVNGMDRQELSKITSVEGAEEACGVYIAWEVPFVNREGKLSSLYGVNSNRFFDFWMYNISGNQEEILKQLDLERTIILNKSIAEKFDYKVGDEVVMELNGRERAYKLIGMTNTLMNNGQIGFISDKYFKNDMGESYYNDIYIRTSEDPEIVVQRLKDKFLRRGVWADTKANMQEVNQESNDQIFVMLQGFSILTMVIGIFGVFNNYLVSMLHRKRSLAMYRSVGMSRQMMRRMLLLESTASGLIGGIAGVAGGLLFVFMVGFMMIAMDLPVAMHIDPNVIISSLIGGIVVSVVASISPVLKSAKMSIIKAIKYE